DPTAVIFGAASDSRVAAEIIFDQGLGDTFVVRTAGSRDRQCRPRIHRVRRRGPQCPLIVVFGHDSCGAVKATLDALDNGAIPAGFIRDVVERVSPSILMGRREGLSTSTTSSAVTSWRPARC
ncbi:hypothetical protein GS545_01235, partial [Rhodococcus hoagii]|nr:hypothetical protein [Prescottella equi]